LEGAAFAQPGPAKNEDNRAKAGESGLDHIESSENGEPDPGRVHPMAQRDAAEDDASREYHYCLIDVHYLFLVDF